MDCGDGISPIFMTYESMALKLLIVGSVCICEGKEWNSKFFSGKTFEILSRLNDMD